MTLKRNQLEFYSLKKRNRKIGETSESSGTHQMANRIESSEDRNEGRLFKERAAQTPQDWMKTKQPSSLKGWWITSRINSKTFTARNITIKFLGAKSSHAGQEPREH